MGEEETPHKTQNITGRLLKLIDRDVLVFSFFLVLSFIFWYLNGLSKEIENSVKYPVRYINPPRDKVLVGTLPSRLELQLKGPGYSILKLRLSGSRAPVVIDMSRINYNSPLRQESDEYYVLTNNLKDNFARQLRADYEILSISPDTLLFQFDRVGTKKVPVIADVNVVTEKEFFVNGEIAVNPDSVFISGPYPVIDTVMHVKTRPRRYANINQPFTRTLQLAGSKDYVISERRVEISVPVEQYTEAKLMLPVKLINRPDSIDVKMFPDEVDVRILVAVSDYNRVFESGIQAHVDFMAINPEASDKLPVSIINVPLWVHSLRYSPQELDYIIENRRR